MRNQRFDSRPDETHRQRVADDHDEVQPHPGGDGRDEHARDQSRKPDTKTSMKAVALREAPSLHGRKDVDAAVNRRDREIAAILEAEAIAEEEEEVVEVVRRGQ